MFRELLAAWRKTDPLKEMYEELISMISLDIGSALGDR